MSGAANHRHTSNQEVATPRDLLDAIERRFGKITFDLAAIPDNTTASNFFSPECNALNQNQTWPTEGINWLNPPFSNVAPWAERCRTWLDGAQPNALTLLLVPASVDSNWWLEHVSRSARVLALNPRVKFVGHKDPFPKPLTLCVYDARFRIQLACVEPWRWK